MVILLQAFWRVLLLRVPPHVIPYSRFLLGALLLMHLLSGSALLAISRPLDEAILSATLGSAMLVVVTHLLLSLFNRGRRSVQSISALAGCEVLINLFSVPVNYWFVAAEKSNAGPPALLLMLLLGWNVALIAHVWRHALDVSKLQGFLYAMGYVILSITLASLIGA
ncbi:MAG TPA: hypothetical protein VGE00_09935 [Gammaproteobacteria bacterium]